MSTKNRIVYFDYLRILASIAVVLLHASVGSWSRVEVSSSSWQAMNFYDGCCRWCVPIFLMISGALFLPEEIPVKKIFKKYIKHLLMIFYVWSAWYAFVYWTMGKSTNRVIKMFLFGEYHQWYLMVAIGLYILTPLIHKIVKDKKSCEYLLLVSFMFSFCLKSVATLMGTFSSAYANSFGTFVDNLFLSNISWSIGYYVLGYYLNTYKTEHTKTIYLLGAVGLIITIVGSSAVSLYLNTTSQVFFENWTPNVLFTSMALFVFAKEHLYSSKHPDLILAWSKLTLGIYLIHPYFQLVLSEYGIYNLMFHPIFAVPVFFMISYLLSALAVFALGKIKYLNKIVS